MRLVESKKRPVDAIAEWPEAWSPLLAECVEVKVPPGTVTINKALVMLCGKRLPQIYSIARQTGLVIEDPPVGFFKRIFRRKKK